MSTNIYVGNLPYKISEEEIRQLFEPFGQVESVNIIQDRETGRSKGFGFVEMDSEGATAAITQLDGSEFGGRNLRVNQAKEREREPRERRPRREY